jgi:hypothetical protein
MVFLVGLLVLVVITWAVIAVRRGTRAGREGVRNTMPRVAPRNDRQPAPPAGPASGTGPAVSAQDVANTIAGWMLGHEIAHGHQGFPGDPLPGGHLGSPSDLAFWGGIFDHDPDDPDF